MSNTIVAVSGYNKTKLELTPLTLDELKALRGGEHLHFLDRHGKARDCKINGKCKTWKRDLNRIEVPCKYGLREYFTVYTVGELFTARLYTQQELPL